MVSFLSMHCNSMSLCPVSGAIGVSAGSAFSDVSREVFFVSPDCVGNESSLVECSQNRSLPCAAQGGVGVVCQGMYLHSNTFFWTSNSMNLIVTMVPLLHVDICLPE